MKSQYGSLNKIYVTITSFVNMDGGNLGPHPRLAIGNQWPLREGALVFSVDEMVIQS